MVAAQRKNRPKTGQNRPKTGQNWPFLVARASGERWTTSEAIRQHHPCYTKAPSSPVPPGGFQGAEMADILLRSRRSPRNARTGQKRAKTAQKRAKTGHFWLRERAASGGQRAKREAAPSLLYESPIQPKNRLNSQQCVGAAEGRPKNVAVYSVRRLRASEVGGGGGGGAARSLLSECPISPCVVIRMPSLAWEKGHREGQN